MEIDISNLRFKLRDDSQFENLKNVEPSPFVQAAIQVILVVSVIVFFFILVIAGIQWITSKGNPQEIENAKKKITAACVGLLIVFTVFAFIQLLNTFFGTNIGNIGLGTPPSNPPNCPAPTLELNGYQCNPSTMSSFWTWNTSPEAVSYRIQIDNNSNFNSPELNTITQFSPPYVWDNQPIQTYHARVRVESYTSTSSCSGSSAWSNVVTTSACMSPGTCVCDLGNWTENSCNLPYTPNCINDFVCECQLP